MPGMQLNSSRKLSIELGMRLRWIRLGAIAWLNQNHKSKNLSTIALELKEVGRTRPVAWCMQRRMAGGMKQHASPNGSSDCV